MRVSTASGRVQPDRAADACRRGLDVAVATVMLLALAPLMLAGCLLTAMTLGRPIFFRQPRSGLHGAMFSVRKIRTMTNACDSEGRRLPDAARTPLAGALLRRLRVDELPSLLNVLAGEMAIVGPRPLPADYVECTLGGAARASVRPGLTGLAQISGNTMLSPEEKVAIDLHYVARRTIALDVAILARTVMTLATGERRDEALLGRLGVLGCVMPQS